MRKSGEVALSMDAPPATTCKHCMDFLQFILLLHTGCTHSDPRVLAERSSVTQSNVVVQPKVYMHKLWRPPISHMTCESVCTFSFSLFKTWRKTTKRMKLRILVFSWSQLRMRPGQGSTFEGGGGQPSMIRRSSFRHILFWGEDKGDKAGILCYIGQQQG